MQRRNFLQLSSFAPTGFLIRNQKRGGAADSVNSAPQGEKGKLINFFRQRSQSLSKPTEAQAESKHWWDPETTAPSTLPPEIDRPLAFISTPTSVKTILDFYLEVDGLQQLQKRLLSDLVGAISQSDSKTKDLDDVDSVKQIFEIFSEDIKNGNLQEFEALLLAINKNHALDTEQQNKIGSVPESDFKTALINGQDAKSKMNSNEQTYFQEVSNKVSTAYNRSLVKASAVAASVPTTIVQALQRYGFDGLIDITRSKAHILSGEAKSIIGSTGLEGMKFLDSYLKDRCLANFKIVLENIYTGTNGKQFIKEILEQGPEGIQRVQTSINSLGLKIELSAENPMEEIEGLPAYQINKIIKELTKGQDELNLANILAPTHITQALNILGDYFGSDIQMASNELLKIFGETSSDINKTWGRVVSNSQENNQDHKLLQLNMALLTLGSGLALFGHNAGISNFIFGVPNQAISAACKLRRANDTSTEMNLPYFQNTRAEGDCNYISNSAMRLVNTFMQYAFAAVFAQLTGKGAPVVSEFEAHLREIAALLPNTLAKKKLKNEMIDPYLSKVLGEAFPPNGGVNYDQIGNVALKLMIMAADKHANATELEEMHQSKFSNQPTSLAA